MSEEKPPEQNYSGTFLTKIGTKKLISLNNSLVVTTFVAKVTEYLCSGGFFFS